MKKVMTLPLENKPGAQMFSVPSRHRFLSAGICEQGCLQACIEVGMSEGYAEKHRKITVFVLATDEPFPEDRFLVYIGTVSGEGRDTCHVYEAR